MADRPVYDKLAPDYEKALGWLERRFFKGLRERALACMPTESRVLEIGAGTGLNFAHYPRGACGVASELSGEMLKIAATKTNRPAGVHLLQANAHALPFADNSFDAVFCTLVFCSVPDPLRGLREMRRVLRDGGKLIMLEHVRPDGWLGPVFDVLSKATVPLFEDHFNRRTADTAQQAGFQIRKVEKHTRAIFNIIIAEK
jgi:ubiquinone/menaquinone biosynthesis C-methylase UbiE